MFCLLLDIQDSSGLNCALIEKKLDKAVGDWISVPSPNFVDPQTMTDSVTHRLIDDFVQILGSNFWAWGLSQKTKNIW